MRSAYHPERDDPRVVFVAEPGETIHPSDSWRVGRPAYELLSRGYNVSLISAKSGEDVLLAQPDVVVMPRQTPDPKQVRRYVNALHQLGIAVVLDWDDSPDFHPYFHKGTVWERKAQDGWANVALADAVTATTPDLQAHLGRAAKRSYWLPNLIAPTQWAAPMPTNRPQGLTIGVMGGHSHEEDWRSVLPDLWPRLAERYPNLTFVAIGYRPDWLAGLVPAERFVNFGWTGIYDYPQLTKFIDIGLAPLTDTTFNRMKSPIKWMEYTLAGACVIASPIMYETWIAHGQTGLIAKDAQQWYDYCCYLIDNSDVRQGMRVLAAKDVLENHTFTDEKARAWMNVYAQVYREVFRGRLPHAATGPIAAGVQRGQGDQHALLVRPDQPSGGRRVTSGRRG